MNLNQVFLAGNLTRDPEFRRVGDNSVVNFGIAINRRYKDSEDVTFVDCAAWNKTGDIIFENLKKGDPIFVQGRLKFDSWEGENGRRNRLSVVVERMQFVGAKK